MAGLPTAPANFDSTVRLFPTPDNDPVLKLPGEKSVGMLQALRQHATDMRALLPSFEELQGLRTERQQYQQHLDRLTGPAQRAGFALADTDNRVVDTKNKIAKVTHELDRLTAISNERSGRSQAAGHVLRAVEDWLASGVPGNCALAEIEHIPVAKILRKGERIADGIERLQRRGRELRADLHRTRSAIFPASDALVRATEQINRLADAGAPFVDGLLEHLGEIVFADKQVIAKVFNIAANASNGVPAAIHNPPDAIGLVAWLCRDQLIAKIREAVYAAADDDNALSQDQREVKEAEIAADLLAVEREECALVWEACRTGLNVWHRPDANPLAILGLRLETVPRAAPSGSSPGHSFAIGMPR